MSSLEPWKVLKSEYLVRDQWMTLRADSCQTPKGVEVAPYYVQESNDWVNVAAFDAQNRLLLVHQYRHGRGEICTELPCGVMEDGEEPEQAILRELKEETGATVESLTKLPGLSPNPARIQNINHSFLATGTKIVAEQNLDPSEEIRFEFVPVPKVLAMIERGEFLQGLHVATLYLALGKLGLMTFSPEQSGRCS